LESKGSRAFPPAAAGFVLAGGNSVRMGEDKALLSLGGKPLVLHAADLLRPHVRQVYLLGSPERYAPFDLPVLEDEFADSGPLAGLCAGLKHSRFEWNVFLACDVPLLTDRFLQELLARAAVTSAQAVIPKTAAGLQPLTAAYHRSCLPIFESAIRRGDLSVRKVLRLLQREIIGPAAGDNPSQWDEMFRNVNHPEDWKWIRRKTGETGD